MTNITAAMPALGDPTRRAIFERLVDGPRPVGELAEELPVSRPAVSQHLKEAGLVVDHKLGTRRLWRWYERAADGSECDWGRVLAWEPPHRLVLAWEISADWQYDPGLVTEVEVRFHAERDDRTRVELEHRGLEAYGDRAAEMRDTFDSPGGWSGLLQRFAGAAAGGER